MSNARPSDPFNLVLGKLFDAPAANHCSPRRASSLAYIACLLAQTPRLSTRHHFVEGYCRDPSTPQRQKAPLLRSG